MYPLLLLGNHSQTQDWGVFSCTQLKFFWGGDKAYSKMNIEIGQPYGAPEGKHGYAKQMHCNVSANWLLIQITLSILTPCMLVKKHVFVASKVQL